MRLELLSGQEEPQHFPCELPAWGWASHAILVTLQPWAVVTESYLHWRTLFFAKGEVNLVDLKSFHSMESNHVTTGCYVHTIPGSN